MKTQMRFQKLLYTLSLVVAALTIVYAFSFCTGAIAYMGHWQKVSGMSTYGSEELSIVGSYSSEFSAMKETWSNAQTYTNILIALGIVYILIVVVCYAYANSSRRNYYKSNYITSIVLAVFALVWAVLAIMFSVSTQIGILTNDFWNIQAPVVAEGDGYASYMYSSSTWIYIVGYIIALCSLLIAVAVTYNCIWKMKLMKGEKELLKNGVSHVDAVKEVA